MKHLFSSQFFPAALLLLSALLPATGHAVSAGEIDDLRASVSTDSSLNEETVQQLLKDLDQASNQLELAAEFRNRASRLKTDIERAPSQAINFETQLREAKANPADYSKLVKEGSSVADIESQITLATAQPHTHSDGQPNP